MDCDSGSRRGRHRLRWKRRGLSELRYFDKVTFEGGYGREFQNPTIKGLSPLDSAKDASIPIFIFHGDRDQRVPIEQSRKYVSALRRADKLSA